MNKLILPLTLLFVIACSTPKVEQYEYYYYSEKMDSVQMDAFIHGKSVPLTFVNGERYNFKSESPIDDTVIFKLYPDLKLVAKEQRGRARIIEMEK